MIFFSAAPICAGDLTTATPAASSAEILSVAVPLPPEMIAPAWPIRRPGGAVSPATRALAEHRRPPAPWSQVTQRRARTGYEGHDGLVGARRPDEVGGFLLRRAANLANHDDALRLRARARAGRRVGAQPPRATAPTRRAGARLRVLDKALQAVDKVGAVEGVAADAHDRRLAQALDCGLVHGLICQCARPRHDAHLAGLVDVPLRGRARRVGRGGSSRGANRAAAARPPALRPPRSAGPAPA
jgi:hypothetical protein